MKDHELIELLKTKKLTATQYFNLIVADIATCVDKDPVTGVTTALDTNTAQTLIQYFRAKIEGVLLPTIEQLKAGA